MKYYFRNSLSNKVCKTSNSNRNINNYTAVCLSALMFSLCIYKSKFIGKGGYWVRDKIIIELFWKQRISKVSSQASIFETNSALSQLSNITKMFPSLELSKILDLGEISSLNLFIHQQSRVYSWAWNSHQARNAIYKEFEQAFCLSWVSLSLNVCFHPLLVVFLFLCIYLCYISILLTFPKQYNFTMQK